VFIIPINISPLLNLSFFLSDITRNEQLVLQL
jgi:hypothetical protein